VRVLLDEDIPRAFIRDLGGHDVSTVVDMGWASIKNGVLLRLTAAGGFEAFLTADRNIPFQQNVPALGLALVVLAVPKNRIETIRPLVPEILAVLNGDPLPGTLTTIGNWRVN
jgi:hypothetical protein